MLQTTKSDERTLNIKITEYSFGKRWVETTYAPTIYGTVKPLFKVATPRLHFVLSLHKKRIYNKFSTSKCVCEFCQVYNIHFFTFTWSSTTIIYYTSASKFKLQVQRNPNVCPSACLSFSVKHRHKLPPKLWCRSVNHLYWQIQLYF